MKKRSQKSHPTLKIGSDTRQANELLIDNVLQRRIKSTISSLFERLRGQLYWVIKFNDQSEEVKGIRRETK